MNTKQVSLLIEYARPTASVEGVARYREVVAVACATVAYRSVGVDLDRQPAGIANDRGQHANRWGRLADGNGATLGADGSFQLYERIIQPRTISIQFVPA